MFGLLHPMFSRVLDAALARSGPLTAPTRLGAVRFPGSTPFRRDGSRGNGCDATKAPLSRSERSSQGDRERAGVHHSERGRLAGR